MRSKHFKEANVIFAENQPQYTPLPAFRNNNQNGEVVTCWELSLKERLQILLRGEIWLNMLTFNKPLTPVSLTTTKPEIVHYDMPDRSYTLNKK